MNIKIPVLFLFLCLSFFACKKFDNERINKLSSDNVNVNKSLVTATSIILDIGKEGITEYGHCWSVNNEPTISDFKSTKTTEIKTGYFTDTLKNLHPNTTYKIRSYAKNNSTVLYGETKTFTTITTGITVTARNETAVTNTSATVKGIISNLKSLKIQDYGHCWSKTSNPTINDFKTSFGELSQDNEFTSSLTNLELETPFYIRSYAIADNSTILYSDTVILVIPQLQVQTISAQTTSATTATLTGNILKLGVNTVTNHGFCWSYSTSSPDINSTVVSLNSINHTGNFTTILNNISQGITYYYRAFATEGAVIRYGEIKSFTNN